MGPVPLLQFFQLSSNIIFLYRPIHSGSVLRVLLQHCKTYKFLYSKKIADIDLQVKYSTKLYIKAGYKTRNLMLKILRKEYVQ